MHKVSKQKLLKKLTKKRTNKASILVGILFIFSGVFSTYVFASAILNFNFSYEENFVEEKEEDNEVIIISSINGDAPPENGDWIIDELTIVENETIILNGNASIENTGTLKLINSTLKLNVSYDGEYKIENNGSLYINSSVITDGENDTDDNSENDYEFLFWNNANSIFEMKNSTLSECGIEFWTVDYKYYGLWINTNNTIIENSSIMNNYCGVIYYYSELNTLKENQIENIEGYGVILKNSTDNSIQGNLISLSFTGVLFENSEGNFLGKNNISSNNDKGILLFNSNEENVVNNSIKNNSYSITLQNSSLKITNSSLESSVSDFFVLTRSFAASINTTFSTVFVDNSSKLIIKNYLEVLVQDVNAYPIENATVSVKDNGNEVFNDTTDENGLCSWILITDRIYNGSSTPTENETVVQVWYYDFTFDNNPRNVNMENSHTETFQSEQVIPEFNGLIIPIISLIVLFFIFRKLRKKREFR